jgi:hypothetical protein
LTGLCFEFKKSDKKNMLSGKIFSAMKNLHKLFVVFFVLFNYSCATQNQISAQRGYVNSQVFYDQLSPYGDWVENADFGFVWIPDVDQDFSPYSTSGYWVMTDYGWTWISDYPWGWAAFHYGRWDYNNYYGWFWVPDYEWGPSWVSWRTGNGYYGWTPMRPGMSISLSFGNDYRDLDRWNFVRESDFGRADIYRYYAHRNDYNTIIINSKVINNTYIDQSRNTTYISGPSRNDVQRVTGRKINSYSIRDNEKPGQVLKNSQLQIYRPQMRKTNDRGQKPAPSKISNIEEVRQTRDRNSPNQRNRVSPVENNRREQKQPQKQNDRRNQEQQQIENKIQQQQNRQKQEQTQPQRQNDRRNQELQQNERKVQQQQQQQDQQKQIENKNQQQQVQQRQQQQQVERQNQQQQVEKQQRQEKQQDQQRQVRQQERSNQQQQVKQQREEKRQSQKQTPKSQEEQKQQNSDPQKNKRNNR